MFYKMILWADPRKEDFEITTNRVYQLLLVISELGENFKPNYIKVKNKNKTVSFDLTKDNVKEQLLKGINKRYDGEIIEPLGYRISFFSSIKNEEMCGISIHDGSYSEYSSNTVVMSFPENTEYSVDFIEQLEQVFKKCIDIFDPYWGCISNLITPKRFENGYWENNLPTTIHWMNYLNTEKVELIGKSLFEECDITYSLMKNGYYIKLMDLPFDESNDNHIDIQRKVSNQLNLNPKIKS